MDSQESGRDTAKAGRPAGTPRRSAIWWLVLATIAFFDGRRGLRSAARAVVR